MGMRRLPPYFASVALMWALVTVPLACAMAYGSWQGATEAAQDVQLGATTPEDLRAVRSKALTTAPRLQTVHFRHLSHDVIVEGPRYGSKKLRRKLRSFQRTIRAFEEAGQRIGIVIADLGTGSAVIYNADEDFYPASSVKGPHLIAVFEQLVEQGAADLEEACALAEPIVLYSDNDAYVELCHRYGNEVFADWAVLCDAIEADGEDYQQLCDANYPTLTTWQLARLWKRGYAYFDQDTEGARRLKGYFEQRVDSPIRDGLPDADLTLTKAGWYPSFDGNGSAPSTCDAGIVLEDGHCYLVAIMTDAPADLEWLARLVGGLCSARGVLE